MSDIYFNDRKGNTVLNPSEQLGLKLTHISTIKELDEENKKLVEENQQLRKLLFNRSYGGDTLVLDSIQATYTITSGQVIKNSYADRRNYITINKGEKDSVKPDMGVITSEGILGIVENVSNRNATVQSILNERSNIKN